MSLANEGAVDHSFSSLRVNRSTWPLVCGRYGRVHLCPTAGPKFRMSWLVSPYAAPCSTVTGGWSSDGSGGGARVLSLGRFASVRDVQQLKTIPLDRLLSETDHPFGDRFNSAARRPGNVNSVELAVRRLHGLIQDEPRIQMWRNPRTALSAVGVMSRLPRPAKMVPLAV